MTTNKRLYELAALSQGVYGNFPERPTIEEARAVLVGMGPDAGIPQSQAQRLIGPTGYSVLHHQANDDWGFSGMVVRNNVTGEKSIVFRGTEFWVFRKSSG